MSKYERLIIYPLLFLALFCALTGVNVVNATQQMFERIVAREVVIVDNEGNEVAVLKYDEQKQNPSFEMFNKDGRRVLSLLAYADGGAVESSTKRGYLTAAIQNDPTPVPFWFTIGTRDMTKLVALRSGLLMRECWRLSNTQGFPTGIMGNNVPTTAISAVQGASCWAS